LNLLSGFSFDSFIRMNLQRLG